jgi:hypothetical protein
MAVLTLASIRVSPTPLALIPHHHTFSKKPPAANSARKRYSFQDHSAVTAGRVTRTERFLAAESPKPDVKPWLLLEYLARVR